MTEMKGKMAGCSMAAIRYAKVLFELEVDADSIAEARNICENTPELIEALGSPVVAGEKKHKIIEKVFPTAICNFMKVVTDHGRIGIAVEIFQAYADQKDHMEGIVTAHLRYVTPPDEEQKKQMEMWICKEFGANGVKWEMEKEEQLIGGFLLHVNGREYDYSVQGRLNRLEQKLTWR